MSEDKPQMPERSGSFVASRKMERSNSKVAGPMEDVALLQHEIQYQIDNTKDLSPDKQKEIIEDAKQEFDNARKTTSTQTIMSITNTLVGSVILILPFQYQNGGFILSFLMMSMLAFLAIFTCQVLVKYQKIGEKELADIILRLLNPTWAFVYQLTSMILLFIAAIVYFILQNQVCYGFIRFLLAAAFGMDYDSFPQPSEISFTKFSIQYQCMGLIIPIFLLCSMKELTFIIKLAKYGISAVVTYFVFIFYIFFVNITSENFSKKWHDPDTGMQLFTKNFGELAGALALAFFGHNVVNAIVANNEKPQNNVRDLRIGYLFVYIIYLIVGIFGSVGIVGIKVKSPETISDFFPYKKGHFQSYFAQVVNLLFLFQLSTALPILVYIARTQFWRIVLGEQRFNQGVSKFQFNIFNIVWGLVSVGFQISSISPSIVIGIDGAICGYFMFYIIPFAIRYKGLKDEAKNGQYSSINQQSDIKHINNINIASEQNTESLMKESIPQSGSIPIYELVLWGFAVLFGIVLAGLSLYEAVLSI